MQNLLYLQAELTHLESELDRLAKADIDQGNSGDQIKSWYTRNWIILGNVYGNTGNKQWQKMLQIRKKLKEYNSFFLQQHMIARVDNPYKHNLRTLRQLLEKHGPLIGPDMHAWVDENDLMVVRQLENRDVLSLWVIHKLTPLFHRLIGKWFKVCILQVLTDVQ
ncbi:hypothetical protein MMC27_006920 [Xylographa pallens]|nr:hypothetical protein [Xylographa pallens]